MTVSPKAAPETSTEIDIEFVEGVPVKLTNKTDGTVKVRKALKVEYSYICLYVQEMNSSTNIHQILFTPHTLANINTTQD